MVGSSGSGREKISSSNNTTYHHRFTYESKFARKINAMPFLGHGGIWCSVRDQKRNKKKTKLNSLKCSFFVSMCPNVSMCQCVNEPRPMVYAARKMMNAAAMRFLLSRMDQPLCNHLRIQTPTRLGRSDVLAPSLNRTGLSWVCICRRSRCRLPRM